MKLKMAALVSSVVLVSACSTTPEPIETVKAVVMPSTTLFKTNIKATANIEVLNECIPYIVVENEKFVGFMPRYFDFNMDTPKEVSELQESCVVNVLSNYPVKVELQGYTDNVGNKSYNQKLAKRRSESVQQALINSGVNQQQITLVESSTVMAEKSTAFLNRRVNLTLK
jgi:outer membrane protein OmpA-like peptidoglycan-associated protein